MIRQAWYRIRYGPALSPAIQVERVAVMRRVVELMEEEWGSFFLMPAGVQTWVLDLRRRADRMERIGR